MKNDDLNIFTKNVRECRFHWRKLKDRNLNLPVEPTNSNDYCIIINDVLKTGFPNEELRKKEVLNLKQAANTRLLPKEELEWINVANDRLCYWLWGSLRLLNLSSSRWVNEQLIIDAAQDDTNRVYINYGLNPLPHTAKERYQAIIDFLDLTPSSIEAQRVLLQSARALWEEVYLTELFIKPDPSNEVYCRWLWNYITSNEEFIIPYWFIPTPQSPKDMFHSAVAAFDIWQENEYAKKLFITRMKKAWSQKKHRLAMQSKNKKSYSFTLTTDVKNKLDKMAEASDMNKSELLEKLLVEEYDRSYRGD